MPRLGGGTIELMVPTELGPQIPALAAVPEREEAPAAAGERPGTDFPAEAAQLDGMLAQVSDLRCGSCGYGIASYVTPPVCPMCRETNWQPVQRPRPL